MSNRFMIAGTGSGCGKTTITCALLAALASMGKSVVSFKCGPDYIDPMFHKKATGVESRNLDLYLMGESGVKYGLTHHSANKEISVLEGVMGIYDGLGDNSFASSNHVSVLTETPVVLVVNVKGLALSVCAVIKGFLDFEENNIRAVILNNASEGMFPLYKKMIEERLDIPVIGYLPYIPEAQIESRHLGLVTADEIADIKDKISRLKEQALLCVDIERLLEIADVPPLESTQDSLPPIQEKSINGDSNTLLNRHPGLDPGSPHPSKNRHQGMGLRVKPAMTKIVSEEPQEKQPVKLLVAKDKAFCFWYEDNHDLLREMGAEMHFFSPIGDQELPDDADGLLLWGGYPELHGSALENNRSMRQSLKSAISNGLPVYAECGGFVYLQQSLTDLQGENREMLGVLPGNVKMTSKLHNFGYYEIEALRDNILCEKGNKINAHFFRRSVSDHEGDCFKAVKQNGRTFPCVVSEGNVFAGYQHLHFWGNPSFAANFINACAAYKKRSLSRSKG